MFNYVVSINNCVCMSHYRLTMLRDIHNRKISVCEIESIERLDHAFTMFCNCINRLGIDSSDCRFIVCVPRTPKIDNLCNESTLFYRIMIGRLIDEKVKKLEMKSEVSLIIVDYYRDRPTYEELLGEDKYILAHGNYAGSNNIPDLTDFLITDYNEMLTDPTGMIERTTANIAVPECRNFFTERFSSFTDYQRRGEIALPQPSEASSFFVKSFEDYFSNIPFEPDIWKHALLHYAVNFSNSITERHDMVAFIAFLLFCDDDDGSLSRRSPKGLSQETLDLFAAQKADIADRLGLSLSSLQNRFSHPSFVQYESDRFTPDMHSINHNSSKAAEDKLTQYKVKASEMLAKRNARQVISRWTELHEEIAHAIRCAPEIVNRFSADIVDTSAKAVAANKPEPLFPENSDKKEYIDGLQYEKELLTQSLTPEVLTSEDAFTRQKKLAQQLDRTDKVLSYINACSSFIRPKRFLRLLLFVSAAFALMYLVLQGTSIFSSRSGLVTYFSICALAAAAFSLSYAILNIWYNNKVKLLVFRLSKLLDDYFGQYILRIEFFKTRLSNIIRLKNTNQRLKRISGDYAKNDDYGRRIGWHNRKINEYLNDALVYFDPIVSKGSGISAPSAPAIDPYRNDADNEFYWINDDWGRIKND